jgi:two-component system sensor histidine kinase/response regulator
MLVPPADLLLVDDNPANLDVLARLLRQHQHRVRTVTSGALGLAAMRRQVPELVLLDVNMPDLDGYATCQAMQEDAQLAAVPVIFISALDAPVDKVKAFQVGGRDYVTKPFAPEEVLARVEHQVCLRRLQQDLERQNEALVDANLKLKEIHVIKANFTAMLIHDLRSPLTSVGLVLDLMKAGAPLEPKIVAQAGESFARVQTLLNEVLELHRSEQGRLPLETRPYQPSPWLAGVAAVFAVRAEAAGIQFQQSIPADLPTLQGDLGKLDRVLHNLLDNAVKFTPRGGAVRLEAALARGSGVEAGMCFLRISVIDTGRGIPADELPFIFDPFRQGERRDAAQGFGLGLAIVQRLVASHRGQIRAQSQVGFGTSFTVLLPY